MTAHAESIERERAARVLRSLKVGDRVLATIRAPSNRQGLHVTVLDTNHQLGDGTRRVKVRWDNGEEVATLPSSIEKEGSPE